MSVWAVGMGKDEADVIEGVVRHMAGEVDGLVVADNASADGTRDVLEALAKQLPLVVVDDQDPAYRQSAKMSTLAELAVVECGAEWIVPFDADELWTATDGRRIRDLLSDHGGRVVPAALFNHLCTALDVADPDPFRSMVWRQRSPADLPKVAFRWEPGSVIHQGNHGVTLPSVEAELAELDAADASALSDVLYGRCDVRVLEVRHFPVRSPQHLVSKARNGAAAYAAAPELPEDMGNHWRAWGRLLEALGEEGLHTAFREHWWYLSPVDAGLVCDPAPYRRWEEAPGTPLDTSAA